MRFVLWKSGKRSPFYVVYILNFFLDSLPSRGFRTRNDGLTYSTLTLTCFRFAMTPADSNLSEFVLNFVWSAYIVLKEFFSFVMGVMWGPY